PGTPIVLDKVAGSFQIFPDVFVLFFNAPVLVELANRAPAAVAKVIPDKSKLAFGFIEERGLDLLAIEFAFVLQQMVEVGGTGNLQEVRKVTGDLGDSPGVTLERQRCLGGGPGYQVERFLAGECAQKNIREDVEE